MPLTTGGPSIEGLRIASPGGEVVATVHPGLNMLCSSLAWRGVELLHRRGGPAEYAATGRTCGIPLLHPWANRLPGDACELAGRRIDLAAVANRVVRDANGLPIHGLMAGAVPWTAAPPRRDGDATLLEAFFEFDGDQWLAGFPWPHRLDLAMRVADDGLEVALALAATSAAPVPVSFGFHPWLSLEGEERPRWILEVPARTRMELDARGLPTGRRLAMDPMRGPLGDLVLDDLFTDLETPRVLAIEGAGRRVEVEFGEAYPWAQVYAPAGSRFACLEPMTAATAALATGAGPLRFVAAGAPLRAVFRVRVRACAPAVDRARPLA